MGDEGARALTDGLRQNATVTTMDLDGNQIGDEGARALADGLQEDATVTEMDDVARPQMKGSSSFCWDLSFYD